MVCTLRRRCRHKRGPGAFAPEEPKAVGGSCGGALPAARRAHRSASQRALALLLVAAQLVDHAELVHQVLLRQVRAERGRAGPFFYFCLETCRACSTSVTTPAVVGRTHAQSAGCQQGVSPPAQGSLTSSQRCSLSTGSERPGMLGTEVQHRPRLPKGTWLPLSSTNSTTPKAQMSPTRRGVWVRGGRRGASGEQDGQRHRGCGERGPAGVMQPLLAPHPQGCRSRSRLGSAPAQAPDKRPPPPSCPPCGAACREGSARLRGLVARRRAESRAGLRGSWRNATAPRHSTQKVLLQTTTQHGTACAAYVACTAQHAQHSMHSAAQRTSGQHPRCRDGPSAARWPGRRHGPVPPRRW